MERFENGNVYDSSHSEKILLHYFDTIQNSIGADGIFKMTIVTLPEIKVLYHRFLRHVKSV